MTPKPIRNLDRSVSPRPVRGFDPAPLGQSPSPDQFAQETFIRGFEQAPFPTRRDEGQGRAPTGQRSWIFPPDAENQPPPPHNMYEGEPMYASHRDEPMFVYGPPLYGASSWPELVQESTITQLRSWLAGRGIHARRGGKTELVRLVLLESERTPHSAADFQLQPWRSARQEVERRDHGRDARRSDAAILRRAAVQQQRTVLGVVEVSSSLFRRPQPNRKSAEARGARVVSIQRLGWMR